MKQLVLLILSAAVAAILLPASAGASTTPTSTAAAAKSAALAKALTPGGAGSAAGAVTSVGAYSSRWKRPRQMSYFTAQSQARRSARLIYLDPEFTFDDYGAGRCLRNSLTMMRCYTWVSEDVYDDYGYYLDTILCDWMTVSWYQRTGRLQVRTTSTECVLLSEV